jgi:hypothetical protein
MPYLSAKPVAASEGAGFVDFVVRLDAAASSEVRVNVQTENGTAAANQDYTFLRDTLVFAPGETSKTVRVKLLDGTAAEGTEAFWLQLYSPVGAVIDRRRQRCRDDRPQRRAGREPPVPDGGTDRRQRRQRPGCVRRPAERAIDQRGPLHLSDR